MIQRLRGTQGDCSHQDLFAAAALDVAQSIKLCVVLCFRSCHLFLPVALFPPDIPIPGAELEE